MTRFSRREALLVSAAPLVAGGVAKAQSAATPPTVWDLTEPYKSDAAWASERDAVEKALPPLAAFTGKLG